MTPEERVEVLSVMVGLMGAHATSWASHAGKVKPFDFEDWHPEHQKLYAQVSELRDEAIRSRASVHRTA